MSPCPEPQSVVQGGMWIRSGRERVTVGKTLGRRRFLPLDGTVRCVKVRNVTRAATFHLDVERGGWGSA